VCDDRVRALARDAGHILWTARPDGASNNLTTWQLYCGANIGAPALASWLDAIHPEDRSRAERSWGAALAERCVWELCARVRRDGMYRAFLFRAVPVFDRSGALVEWACFGTDVTERRQTEQEIHDRSALRDALTGLPNRLLFEDRLEQAILIARRDQETLAVIVIERQAFQTGDMDLAWQDTAKRLREALRDSDTLARVSAHALAIVLLGADEHGATRLVRKLFLALEHRIAKVPESEVPSAIGIALFPRHGNDAPTLLRHAQAAAATSKQTSGGYAVYGSLQQQQPPRRPLFSDELRAAIERDQLVLHYQPKVDLRTGRVTSVEALVSWKHPLHGAMPRDEVIEVAELSGLIVPFTRWVVDAALRQCGVWKGEGIDIGVSINLSIRNLHDPALVDEIAGSLRVYGVRPPKLTIEIDEGSIAKMPDVARRVIDRFHAFGVNVSVDGFGAGYSALSLLARLPIREVKIDRALVSRMEIDEHDALVVRTLIDAGHSLGLRVVAEGVETRHTLNLVANLDCDYAQGYVISEPLEADDVPRGIATSYVVPK
jgi:diguanylate cyclase